MTFVETFLLSIFDTVMILIISHRIRRDVFTTFLQKVLFVVLTTGFIAFFSTYVSNNHISHLLSVIFTITSINMYLRFGGEKSIVRNTLLFFTTSIMLIAIQMLTIVIVHLVFGNIEYTFTNGLLAQSTSIIIVVLLAKFAPLQKIDAFIVGTNSLFRFVITTTFVLYYGITILWFSDIQLVTATPLGAIVLIMLAVVVNTIILREGFVNEMYKNKLEVLETYTPIVEDMITELRSRQHDYHNHIQTLISMNFGGTFASEQTEKYIDDITNNELLNILRKMDDPIVGAFLHSKAREASKYGMDMILDIKRRIPDSIFETYELIEMYGILIDNAFDAAKRVDAFPKSVFVTVDQKDNHILFEVRNHYGYVSIKDINGFFQKGNTTKTVPGHGFGLYKLKRMLEKKSSSILLSYDTEREQIVAQLRLAVA